MPLSPRWERAYVSNFSSHTFHFRSDSRGPGDVEEKFETYARSHLGGNGIPLSYVIRKNDLPRSNGNFSDFLSQTIECAPLTGEYYMADRVTVFNMLVSFTTGQPSHDWIKSTNPWRHFVIISKERVMRQGIKMRLIDSKIAYIIKASDLWRSKTSWLFPLPNAISWSKRDRRLVKIGMKTWVPISSQMQTESNN